MHLTDQLKESLAQTYTVERELGGGGMSHVFLATENALGRRVVIKVLPPEMSSVTLAERFRREISLAATLRHPNILPLLTAGDADGLLYYMMPFVEGETLRERLREDGALGVADAVRILRDVADALSFAHQRGVVHRDIKPENVLLEHGHAVVTDFGVAKAIANASGGSHTGAGITTTGVALGTITYMAPEQAAADPATDHRADLYSLGIMAYELFTGSAPFAGRSPHQVITAHMTEQAEPLWNARPDLPPSIAELVMRLLEKDPDQRPGGALEVVRTLDEFLTSGSSRLTAATDAARLVSAAAGAARSTTGTPRTRAVWIGALVLALAVAGLGIQAAARRGNTGAQADRRAAATTTSASVQPAYERGSIAVLPFTDLSRDEDQAYLSEGIAEELMSQLARVKGLRVVARASAFQFTSPTADVREIGRLLGVAHILIGSVRRQDNRIRVSVQLVDTRTGYQLWADTHERQLSDVFRTQDEISRAVAAALHLQLVSSPTTPKAAPTGDLQAYELYLRGVHLLNRQQVPQATALLLQATIRDSAFARAHAALAEAYAVLAAYSDRPPLETLPKGITAARVALRLDPTLSDAHAALGWLKMINLQWDEAERSLRRAVELDANSSRARNNYAIYLHRQGRLAEALEQMRIARQLDPLSLLTTSLYASYVAEAGNLEQALEHLHTVLALDPDFPVVHGVLGYVHTMAGRPREAVRHYARAAELVPRSIHLGLLGHALARAGHTAEARAVLAELKRRMQTGVYVSPAAVGWVHLGLEERDEGFTLLNRAVDSRDVFLTMYGVLKNKHFVAPYADDLRFQRLTRRAGLGS